MNFYLLQDDRATSALLRDLIENDFDNTLVGLTADPNRAYEELLQLRVDIMILPYQPHGMDGVELIYRLQQVNNQPHFIMVGPPIPIAKEAAYRAGCDFYLSHPLNPVSYTHLPWPASLDTGPSFVPPTPGCAPKPGDGGLRRRWLTGR